MLLNIGLHGGAQTAEGHNAISDSIFKTSQCMTLCLIVSDKAAGTEGRHNET
jgi:hypothetical protein